MKVPIISTARQGRAARLNRTDGRGLVPAPPAERGGGTLLSARGPEAAHPLATGLTIRLQTDSPPALSPAIVTALALPPKRCAFCRQRPPAFGTVIGSETRAVKTNHEGRLTAWTHWSAVI